MKNIDPRPLASLLLVALPVLGIALAAGSCTSQDPAPDEARAIPADAPVLLPWTQRFMSPAVLVADTIVVEGPDDLVDHVAVRQEPEYFTYETKTTRDGLRTVIRRRSEARGAEIRAQLDAWSLGAMEMMVVLQRPGDAQVIVRAQGSAVWIPTDGASELRQSAIEFRGDRP